MTTNATKASRTKAQKAAHTIHQASVLLESYGADAELAKKVERFAARLYTDALQAERRANDQCIKCSLPSSGSELCAHCEGR